MNIFQKSVFHMKTDALIFQQLSFLCATSFFAAVVYLTFNVLDSCF